MKLDERFNSRLQALLAEASNLGASATPRPTLHFEREMWLTSAMNVAEQLTPMGSSYRRAAVMARHAIVGTDGNRVEELSAVLSALSTDIEHGVVGSVGDRARTETFVDLLAQAEHYLRGRHVQPAGVLAGVIFEDTIRRVCNRRTVGKVGGKLDVLITELAAAGVLTEVEAPRARTSAALRTRATHANWDQFSASDVAETIKFTRELITRLLA